MSSGGGMNLNANSLADEVQNYLSSDFKQYNNPKQYNSQHGGHHPSSSSTGGGATPSGFHNDMANSSLGYHLQQRHAAGRSQQGFHQAPGGGQQHNGHGGGNAASMHQLNHTTGGSSGAMMRSHSYSTTSNTGTGGPHGHHPSNINMAGGPPGSGGGMPMSGGLGNVGPTSSSSTTNGAFNMLPHHQTLGGFQNPAGPHVVSNGLYGSHSSTAFNIDTFQHSNHNHMNLAGSWSMNNTGPGGAGTINGMHGGPSLGDQQDFKDRLRLLKNRVRHDHRGMLRSEGSMQPSTSSMHNLDQRSVMSAGEAIPWGLGVISLSKVDHNFSNSIASSLQQHRSGGTRRALARSRSTASDTGVGTSCAGSASGAGVGSKRSGLDVTHRRWPRANAGVVAS
ncbi:unnamed protein product [Amoebophrya sp. A25]|nr:unnamed protein product [Amoebophrya sp. A25]|eukprot:GSA25T00014912001.1